MRVTPAEAADFPGPKYLVPEGWERSVGIVVSFDGWEEYHPPLASKPWWQFW